MPAAQNPLTADLAVLADQERLLRFATFNADTAFALGGLLRGKLLALQAAATLEIEFNQQLLFAACTQGATPGQADWIRRKRNTVRRFARSTYAVGRQLELDDQTLQSRHGLAIADYAAHGGGFPLWLGPATAGTPLAGSIVLSGLAQRDDHNLVVAALSELLQIDVPHLA